MSEIRETLPIIESNNFIVLENYTKAEQAGELSDRSRVRKRADRRFTSSGLRISELSNNSRCSSSEFA